MCNLVLLTAEHRASTSTELCVITQDLEPCEYTAGISQLLTSCTGRIVSVCLASHFPTLKFICHFIIPPPHFRASSCTSSHFTLIFTTPNSLQFCQNSFLFCLFLYQAPAASLKQRRSQHRPRSTLPVTSF